MKNIPNQLSLFNDVKEDAFRKTAEELLDLLNDGVKPKDHYRIEYYYEHLDMFVLIACNREKNIVCNVVDINGKIPKDFCVNWRSHNHIFHELNIEIIA